MITSRPVLQQVIEEQKLDMSYEQLKARIRITNPTDTRILNMTVTDIDPVRAKAIVDEVARASSDYIGDIMEMIPPKIIEEGVVPSTATSPNVKKNAVLGGLAFAMAAGGLIAVQVILNDTVRSEEDVERYLGISVLAAIPDDEGMAEERRRISDKRKNSRKKRKMQRKDKEA